MLRGGHGGGGHNDGQVGRRQSCPIEVVIRQTTGTRQTSDNNVLAEVVLSATVPLLGQLSIIEPLDAGGHKTSTTCSRISALRDHTRRLCSWCVSFPP